MVDQNILLSKLGYVEKNLVYLESLGKIKEKDFSSSGGRDCGGRPGKNLAAIG